MSTKPSTGQQFREKTILNELLRRKIVSFTPGDIIPGLTALLIPTDTSENEVNILETRLRPLGAETFSKGGIVYIRIPRRSEFSLFVKGFFLIIIGVIMILLPAYINILK